jgi:hypothetical protein
MKVNWNEIDHRTYEDMVAVLLSRLHPDSQRIDGTGGDGGRDVQFATPDGLHVFELKSFTGRVSKSRRPQITRSLNRAKELEPVEWVLVVPIDPTPAEERWFNQIRNDVPFPLVWRGRTWLDAEMTTRPEIHRYFVEGAAAEVVRLLAELQAENAMPRSVGDALARLQTLHDRLDELDPHYTYDLAVGREVASTRPHGAILSASIANARVDVYPRYVGAERDRPITINVTFAFASEDSAYLQELIRSIDYGTPVSLPGRVVAQFELDAPLGLGVSQSPVAIEIGGSSPSANGPIRFVAEIRNGVRLLASLPLDFKVSNRGRKGLIFTGSDSTGWLRLRLTANIENKELTVNLGVEQAPVLPAAVLPLLRWLVHLRAPNELQLLSSVGSTAAPVLLSNEPFVDETMLKIVEALDDVQRESGASFDLPVDITLEEAQLIIEARRLLAGQQVEATWCSPMRIDMTLNEDAELNPGGSLTSPEGAALLIERDEEIELRGHRIPLGRVRTMFKSARVADPDTLRTALASGNRDVTLEFIPGADNSVTRQRVASS